MTHPRLIRHLVFAALGFAAGAASATGDRLEALVTRVDEEVTTGDPIRRLREDDRIPEGTMIHIPAEESVALLCSSDRWIELRGPRTWTLAPGACDPGTLQDLGTFRRLVPHAGRYEIASLFLVRRRSVRAEPDQPIVLSPRQTAVREPRPPLVWRALHRQGDEKAEYEIEITGLNTPYLLSAWQADCRVQPSWGNMRVCTSPWPEEHSGLKRGKRLFWNVGYRASIAAPLVQIRKPVRVSHPSLEASEQLERSLEKLVALPLNATHRSLAAAGLYAEQQLYAEALNQLQEITERDDALQITIGDLYLAMGLAELASERYREILATAPEAATEAAAAYGLGRSLSALQQLDDAIEAFRRAQEQYENGGYTKLAEDAREAQEAVARTLPR